jgi:hypothetical protein
MVEICALAVLVELLYGYSAWDDVDVLICGRPEGSPVLCVDGSTDVEPNDMTYPGTGESSDVG